MPPPEDQIRELPKSLQGIELILKFLNAQENEPSSIRNVSTQTGLSMRVAKNILLQLEKFKQIERIVEKNNILPKWRITKFGKKVVKEAEGFENNIEFGSQEDELIHKIDIPDNSEKLKGENKQKHKSIISKLGKLQVDLSKIMGPILNLNDPIFEELINFLVKRVKYLKHIVITIPIDLIASYTLKKMGEKQKKVTKEEEKFLLLETYFFNSIILNELKRIDDFGNRLAICIENRTLTRCFSIAKDLREEIRVLTVLIDQRKSIDVYLHILSIDQLKQLDKNEIDLKLLDNIIEIPMSADEWKDGIKDIVLEFIGMINKSQKTFNDHNFELTESIPLFALYHLILDEKPRLNFSIEQLEKTLNSLADDGFIPGIQIIQEDDKHYLKVVQLKVRDISEDEKHLIFCAVRLQRFTLADIIEETGWKIEKVTDILNLLTEIGILRYSKSFLYGEQWYVISNRK